MKIYENLDLKDLENEIWKDIKNYEGLYKVSNLGRVKSFIKWKDTSCRILKQCKNHKGYFCVDLHKNKKSKTKVVHRLVYETFKEILEKNYDVHHINKDEEYNFTDNLESKPHSKHSKYHNEGKILSSETKIKISKTRKEKFKNGELNFKGENHPQHKLTEEQVIQIKLLLEEGKLTQQEIADIFGVCRITISDIKRGKIWSYVK